jgi:hypothetical protein
VGNFTVYSLPDVASYALALFPVLLLAAIFWSRRPARS